MIDVFEYDVFLSFASEDEEIVKPIWQEMCLGGLRIFWSDINLKNKLGESWFAVIQSSLERSRHFVLVCTPSSMSSAWVKREYEAFYNHCYKPGVRRLIPILAPNYKVSDLPLFLRDLEACRLDAENAIKNIIQLLGGTDIQALKLQNEKLHQELATKDAENKKLKQELEVKFVEDKGLKDKMLEYENEIKQLKDQLAKPNISIPESVPKMIIPEPDKLTEDNLSEAISAVEVKTNSFYSSEAREYETYLSNTNAPGIFVKHLAKTCTYNDFLWLLQQTNIPGKEKVDKAKPLLLALEYAKRHRTQADPEVIACVDFGAESLIQDIQVEYLMTSPLKKLVFDCFKEWVISTFYSFIKEKIVKFLCGIPGKEAIEPLLSVAYEGKRSISSEAVKYLAKYHDEKIYEAASELLFSKDMDVVEAAAKILSCYSENNERSFEMLSQSAHSVQSENALKAILSSMYVINKDEAVKFYLEAYQTYCNRYFVGDKYLLEGLMNVIIQIDILQITPSYLPQIKKMLNEIVNIKGISDYRRSDIQKIAEKIDTK